METRGTRKQKAKSLIRRLSEGPYFSIYDSNHPLSKKIKEEFVAWSESWVIPIVKELVPELRKKLGKD